MVLNLPVFSLIFTSNNEFLQLQHEIIDTLLAELDWRLADLLGCNPIVVASFCHKSVTLGRRKIV